MYTAANLVLAGTSLEIWTYRRHAAHYIYAGKGTAIPIETWTGP
jgi:hypothetical protein